MRKQFSTPREVLSNRNNWSAKRKQHNGGLLGWCARNLDRPEGARFDFHCQRKTRGSRFRAKSQTWVPMMLRFRLKTIMRWVHIAKTWKYAYVVWGMLNQMVTMFHQVSLIEYDCTVHTLRKPFALVASMVVRLIYISCPLIFCSELNCVSSIWLFIHGCSSWRWHRLRWSCASRHSSAPRSSQFICKIIIMNFASSVSFHKGHYSSITNR